MSENSTILIVDDEKIGRSVLNALLVGENYHLEYAIDGESALVAVGKWYPDLVLLDVMMPGMDGFEVTRRIRAMPDVGEVPILLVTALDDQDARITGLEAGADDFITKPFDRIEMRARIRTILRLNRFRKMNQERESYRYLFEHAPCGLVVMDEDGVIRSANRAAYHLIQPIIGDVIGSKLAEIFAPGETERFTQQVTKIKQNEEQSQMELKLDRIQNGWAAVTVSMIQNQAVGSYLVTLMNRTAERTLELELRQAQKIECIGRLAGGVAHDFNNLLTVINGFSSIALSQLPENDPMREMITQVYQAGERAANLTRQLLAFSRKEMITPITLNLNDVIRGLEKMMRRLIGEHITIRLELAAEIGLIRADPGSIEQVLINLIVNARDAMPQGGKLTITTESVDGKKDGEANYSIRLCVIDTGCGMSEEIKERIFDPFFTTKEAGKGTGLGLATVEGIIRQSNGRIQVSSVVGVGSRFEITFPCVCTEEMRNEETSKKSITSGRANARILLAEDEETVRSFAIAALESAGYQVIAAENGEEAYRFAKQSEIPIDLLLTDAVMPMMGGLELAQKLTKEKPGLRVLYSSGYEDDESLLHGISDSETAFLRKPYNIATLLGKVHEVLDQ